MPMPTSSRATALFTFAAAMRRNELDYDRFYATHPAGGRRSNPGGARRRPPAVQPADSPRRHATHESTESHAAGLPAQPRHVVLIMVESLSAEFVGAYGSTKGLTPNLDRFAREGLKFTNAYATGTRTVRGLEAASVGTPPVPGQSIVRRPDNERPRRRSAVFSSGRATRRASSTAAMATSTT